MSHSDIINGQFKIYDLYSDLEKLKEYLSSGGNPNLRVSDQGALLHHTTSLDIVKELLSHGASVDQSNSYSETPLLYATAHSREFAIIRELLMHGAAVNATDRKGYTPLNHAVKRSSCLETVQELLKYGADINIRNRENRTLSQYCTPLDHAANQPEHAKLLIKFTLIKHFDKDYKKVIDLTPYRKWSTYPELSNYLNDCVCEILRMKTYLAKGNVSLYELVTNKINKYVHRGHHVARFLAGLTNTDCFISFPIYYDIILHKLAPYTKRLELLENLSNKKIYVWKDKINLVKVELNYDCADKIAEYLSDSDLVNLTAAFDTGSSKNHNAPCATQSLLSEPCTGDCVKRPKLE